MKKSITNKDKKKFGAHDTDTEHMTRKGMAPPPRIIDFSKLQSLGINIPELSLIHNLMRSGNEKDQPTCDVLHQRFEKKIPYTDRKQVWGDRGRKALTRHGWIEMVIDIAGEGKVIKEKRKAQDFPEIWTNHTFLLFTSFLDNYIENVFPMYLHFVLKSTPILPLPFKYLELYVRSQYSNDMNLFGDFQVSDIGSKFRKPISSDL